MRKQIKNATGKQMKYGLWHDSPPQTANSRISPVSTLS
jgi:hypothetical protein